MKAFLPFTLLISAFLLIGCSHSDKKHQQTTPSYIIYSPNGEPLNGGPLGRPTCEKALSDWFSRVSATHNGVIPRDVFLSDTDTQFARMDIDHNGYLVSEELDRFREPYRQQQAVSQKQGHGSDTDTQQRQAQGHRHDKQSGGGNSESHSIQSDASLFDPVMSADTNLDSRVTPEEFKKQAQETFGTLDSNHNGLLESTEVMTLCQQKK